MESPPYDIIEYLVAHGAYVEAARIATDRGELRRAISLYERVWRFVDALPLAITLGDRGLAVRLALDGNLPARATEIADAATAEAAPSIAANIERLGWILLNAEPKLFNLAAPVQVTHDVHDVGKFDWTRLRGYGHHQ